MAKKSELHSAATVFTSWGLYYTNIAKAYVQSAQRGNFKPLMGLLGMASLWYWKMSLLSDSDNYFVSSFGKKGLTRTPGLSAITLPYDMLSRDFGGFAVAPVAFLTNSFIKPLAVMNDGVNKNKDKFDWMSEQLWQYNSPMTSTAKEFGNIFSEISK